MEILAVATRVLEYGSRKIRRLQALCKDTIVGRGHADPARKTE